MAATGSDSKSRLDSGPDRYSTEVDMFDEQWLTNAGMKNVESKRMRWYGSTEQAMRAGRRLLLADETKVLMRC